MHRNVGNNKLIYFYFCWNNKKITKTSIILVKLIIFRPQCVKYIRILYFLTIGKLLSVHFIKYTLYFPFLAMYFCQMSHITIIEVPAITMQVVILYDGTSNSRKMIFTWRPQRSCARWGICAKRGVDQSCTDSIRTQGNLINFMTSFAAA